MNDSDNIYKTLSADTEISLDEESLKELTEIMGIPMTKPRAKMISFVLANLCRVDQNTLDKAMRLRITNTSGHNKATLSNFCHSLDYHNYIDLELGKMNKGRFRSSKAYITKKLSDIISAIKPKLHSSDRRVSLYLDGSMCVLDVSDMPPEVVSRNELLNDYYDLLSQCDIELDDRKINPISIRSIYTDNFDSHGRIYADWQVIPSKDRPRLTLDKEPTVELDYSCMGANIAYGLSNRILSKDAYIFKSGLSRSDNKVVMSIALNTSSRHIAKMAISSNVDGDFCTEKVLQSLERYHLPIKNKLYVNLGMTIMNIDGKVCEEVIRLMMSKGKEVLCIHDGFICKKKDEDTLRDIMETAYESVVGNKSPSIK